MRRVIVDMTKRGTVWMMALVFAASLLAAPAAMARKTGDQGPQKGDKGVVDGFRGQRKMFFEIQEDGGGGFVAPQGFTQGAPSTTRRRVALNVLLQFYAGFLVRR